MSSAILSMPPEVLNLILSHLEIFEIERFASCCKSARQSVFGTDGRGDLYLWRTLFRRDFDFPPPLFADPKTHQQDVNAQSSTLADLSLRRSRASLAYKDPNALNMIKNYDRIIDTLVSVAEGRNLDRDSPCRNAEWLERLVKESGPQAWNRWVFPRPLITSFSDWKTNGDSEQQAEQDSTPSKRRKLSGSSTNPASSSQSATAGPSRPTGAKKRESSANRERRRSGRLLARKYPSALSEILADGDDSTLHLSQVNPQQAARLHCLHGVRPPITNSYRWDSRFLGPADASTSSRPEASQSISTIAMSNRTANEERDPNHAWYRTLLDVEGSLFGFSHTHDRDEERRIRAQARARVYDSGRFGFENSYGPFRTFRYEPLQNGNGQARGDEPLRDPPVNEDELSSDEDDIPSDPVPILMSDSEDEDEHDHDHHHDAHEESDDHDEGVTIEQMGDDGHVHTFRLVMTDEEGTGSSSEDGTFIEGSEPDDSDHDDHHNDGDQDDEEYDFMDLTDLIRYPTLFRHQGSYARQEALELHRQRYGREADAKPGKAVLVRQKQIDWEILEAIMVVMHANLRESRVDGWGESIRLPKVVDPVTKAEFDPMEDRLFLDLPRGWWMSRGEAYEDSKAKEETAQDAADAGTAQSAEKATQSKPHDWARAESFWAGTYAFLDYTHFILYNVRMARYLASRQIASHTSTDHHQQQQQQQQAAAGTRKRPDLIRNFEAVGDCLQLRLELLPHSDEDQDTDGGEHPLYPTLRFRGRTHTFTSTGSLNPRGDVHGRVRPVMENGRIAGIHWSIVHAYDGEDRWQLEGVQPGPPGTRAPIYGIWTDCTHEHNSPNGPWVYWRMDDRPWKEIDALLGRH